MKKAILCFPDVPSRQVQYPTGLYKIATHCNPYYESIILDARIDSDIVEKISVILDNDHDVLCLGLSVMTGEQITSAIRISRELHSRVRIVWGGMHPTILPKQTLANDFIDFVVIGEGEEAFLNLLWYLDGHKPHQEMFLSQDNHNYAHNYVTNLDDGKYVDFDVYPIRDEYFVQREGFTRAFTLETSRGCPHRCYFCHNSAHRTPYRSLPWSRVVEVINSLKKVYGIDGVVFQEDNMFANRRRALGILDSLASRRDIGWKANGRVDYFRKYIGDSQLMEDLVLSGCKTLVGRDFPLQ